MQINYKKKLSAPKSNRTQYTSTLLAKFFTENVLASDRIVGN